MTFIDIVRPRDAYPTVVLLCWAARSYVPSIITFNGLVATLSMEGSFDGGDQGLLNQYFSSWASSSAAHRLPFGYNMTANTSYGYAPAYERFKHSVKIVHFIGSAKPWHGVNVGQNRTLGQSARYSELMQRWWDVKDALDTAKVCLVNSPPPVSGN